MKTISVTAVAVLLAVMFGLAGVARAADNPAFWKFQAKGDFAPVLTDLKNGLQAAQFIITAEEHLSKGLENSKHLFPDGKWNTIGFDNVTAVHFCSLVFNQEVFNINMDWSVLCPFKLVVYTMKKAPKDVTIIIQRPSFALEKDSHPRAKEIGKKIDERIMTAIKEGVLR